MFILLSGERADRYERLVYPIDRGNPINGNLRGCKHLTPLGIGRLRTSIPNGVATCRRGRSLVTYSLYRKSTEGPKTALKQESRGEHATARTVRKISGRYPGPRQGFQARRKDSKGRNWQLLPTFASHRRKQEGPVSCAFPDGWRALSEKKIVERSSRTGRTLQGLRGRTD